MLITSLWLVLMFEVIYDAMFQEAVISSADYVSLPVAAVISLVGGSLIAWGWSCVWSLGCLFQTDRLPCQLLKYTAISFMGGFIIGYTSLWLTENNHKLSEQGFYPMYFAWLCVLLMRVALLLCWWLHFHYLRHDEL